MRVFSNTAMAVLVVVALFWGNCFSCPQVLLALQSHQTKHGCCHRTKTTTENCQTQVLRHFVKADSGTATAHAPAMSGPVVALTIEIPHSSIAVALLVEYTPPDLLSLHSNFRI